MVEDIIASLNVAVMTATPVAPFRGFVEFTVGAVVSTTGEVGDLLLPKQPAETARSRGSAITARLR
jgi:hypothetical protein